MPTLVTSGSVMMCSFGAAPCPLTVLPTNKVMCGTPAATIMDHIPMVNIKPFGMCTAPTNPAVIAALGAPSACIPVTAAPWVPGSATVSIGSLPALNSTSKCMCAYAGVIQITVPAQVTTSVA